MDRERLIFRVEATKTGVPLELPVTRQLAALLERRWEESGTLPEGWVFPSTITGMEAGQAISGTWARSPVSALSCISASSAKAGADRGKVFPPFLLRMVRWLDPDAPAQIDV